MYRGELKVARDERARAEEELTIAQEKLRGLQQASLAQGEGTASASTPSSAAIQAMQKDFEERMERSRDEVQYLRKKCDEKERRCEQLLAEKSSLAAEFRAMRGTSSGGGSLAFAVAEADLETGKGFRAGKDRGAGGDRSSVRSLALSAPAWLRSADEPLRLVVKTLAAFPQARLLFFSYVILLHFWVLFLLQNAAVGGASKSLDAALSDASPMLQDGSAALPGGDAAASLKQAVVVA